MRRRLIFILILVIGFVCILFFLSRNSYWDGGSRFRLLAGSSNGNVEFLLFDPKKQAITVYKLPLEEVLESAYGLGEWKVGSLWKLGEQENKGGGPMLSASLKRGLGLPVEGFMETKVGVSSFSLAKSLLMARSTDISFWDRVKLSLFAVRTKLQDGGMLSAQEIILTGEELPKITDGIVTLTQTTKLTQSELKSFSMLISNLGGKVLDVSLGAEEAGNCKVTGSSRFAVKLARVFSCKYVYENKEGIDFISGGAFADNF